MKHYPGLSQVEVENRRLKYGFNELRVAPKVPLWKKFLLQFTDLMVVILIGAAVVSIIVALAQNSVEELIDAYVILGIVVLNACIGFVQEFKTEKALEALQKMMSPKARVFRDGEERMIDAKELVPGDVLVLAEGDKVSADALVLEAHEPRVEESALTGESLPVSKFALKVEAERGRLLSGEMFLDDELHNIAKSMRIFTGTSLVSGQVLAVVVNTGMRTEFGKIAELTSSTVKDVSPLQKELTNIGLFVGKVTLFLCIILFLVGVFIQGQKFIEALLFAVSVAVAAVPEGLPATITIALALGVQRLVKKNAIMKQLSSVETLGSTTVICSDKTGTLTKNQMTVQKVYLSSGAQMHFGGVGYEPLGRVEVFEKEQAEGQMFADYKGPALNDIQHMTNIVSVCNNASLVRENGEWRILGDPTEGALQTAARKIQSTPQIFDRLQEFPFDSVRKRMSVIVQSSEQQKQQLFIKGAPDSVMAICTHLLVNGQVQKMTSADRERIMTMNNEMADKALRVLAVAYRDLSLTKKPEETVKEEMEQDLIFVGLIGMIDPPRPEVKEAIKLCHQAGIRAIIITGDYGKTALAIARELGMVSSQNCRLISGEDLEKLTEAELQDVLKSKTEIIFARVAPDHKMRVVNALKELGEIVAVTGDGVNDAPALKRADIGVAMGITGTDVAKEASNMVLTDDSFATIVNAVEEGRIIYKNLRKFVWYILSCNVGELVIVFSAIILFIPAPLTAILILCVNVGTDVLPALALGTDPAEPGIMQERPRDPKARIMNRAFIWHFLFIGIVIGFLVVGVYIYDLMAHGWSFGESVMTKSDVHRHGITMAFATLVMIQMVNAFNARSETLSNFRLKVNYKLWLAVLISVFLTIAMIHFPFFQNILHTVALSWQDWTVVLIVSIVIFVVEEIRKLLMHRKVEGHS